MRPPLPGFPVSGPQGMGNRETASKLLNLRMLPFPGEVGCPAHLGKPLEGRSAHGSGDAGQNRGADSGLTLPWNGAKVLGRGRAGELPSGTGRDGMVKTP
jgi:hypothetical protein